LFGRRAVPLMLLPSLALAMLGFGLPVNLFSVNMAIYLAPYLLLGIALARALPDPALRPVQKGLLLGAAAAVFLIVLGMSYPEPGWLNAPRTSLLGYAIGTASCVLAHVALPVVPGVWRLGPFTFSIYLYHVLFTSASRRVLTLLGVDAIWLAVLLGVVAGVAGRLLLHELCQRFAPPRRLVLGLRR